MMDEIARPTGSETARYVKNEQLAHEKLKAYGRSVVLSPVEFEIFRLCKINVKENIPFRLRDEWYSGNWMKKCEITVHPNIIRRIFSQHNHSVIFRMPRGEEILLLCCGNKPVDFSLDSTERHIHPRAYTVDRNPGMNPCAVMDWLKADSRSFLDRRFSVIVDEGSLYHMCKTSRYRHAKLVNYFKAASEKIRKDGLLLITGCSRGDYQYLNFHPQFEKLAFVQSREIPDRKTAESIKQYISLPSPGLVDNLEYQVYQGVAVLKKT
ncbi:hypothetical protein [Endozoicomonas elysicola]|uniref:Uncharacterized protein n=1 Tax=Endozoicomonas elysicola TaxID=305900 RepID=A0A081K628_9GAMM|nr:hypothetical protein [Endozoicomonas elysicola]KEI69604.1 hypothetical protein GV64_01575 [Endozoicomonas elysicola]